MELGFANSTRTALRRVVAVALLAMLLAQAGPRVQAQDAGIPPLPILLEGNVLLDGDPVMNGELVARIEDWESRRVPVVDGAFRCADPCLIVGPPNFSYVDKPVTFHLDDRYVASYSFLFPNQASPTRNTVDLHFGAAAAGIGPGLDLISGRESAGGGDSRTPAWLIAAIAVVGVTVASAAGALMLRRSRR